MLSAGATRRWNRTHVGCLRWLSNWIQKKVAGPHWIHWLPIKEHHIKQINQSINQLIRKSSILAAWMEADEASAPSSPSLPSPPSPNTSPILSASFSLPQGANQDGASKQPPAKEKKNGSSECEMAEAESRPLLPPSYWAELACRVHRDSSHWESNENHWGLLWRSGTAISARTLLHAKGFGVIFYFLLSFLLSFHYFPVLLSSPLTGVWSPLSGGLISCFCGLYPFVTTSRRARLCIWLLLRHAGWRVRGEDRTDWSRGRFVIDGAACMLIDWREMGESEGFRASDFREKKMGFVERNLEQ